MTASYEIAPSMDLFRFNNCDILGDFDTSHSNQGHQQPITHAMISAFDPETMRSRPGITKTGSMHSINTQWSTGTTQASNTTKRKSEKKQKKSNFGCFVKILMKIVKEKDEGRFQNAKAVIRNCQQQKKHGEIHSLSENLRCPLKDIVGPRFWKEALDHMSATSLDSTDKKSSIGSTIERFTRSPATTTSLSSSYIHQKGELSSQSTATDGPKISTTTNNKRSLTATDLALRKKRLWMIVRIFMQHLRRKDCQLYKKAHTLVNECVRHHKRLKHFENNNSLSGSIQACLKKEFGLEHWKRAEQRVDEILSVRKND